MGELKAYMNVIFSCNVSCMSNEGYANLQHIALLRPRTISFGPMREELAIAYHRVLTQEVEHPIYQLDSWEKDS